VAKAKSIWRLDQTVRALAEAMQIADSARIIAEFEQEDAREARAQAEQASQAKTAFLANMSHEIRTPMNAILGFAELMRRDPGLSSTQRENLAVIHRSGETLLDLINGILDLSKIEAGLLPLNEGPFGLPGLFREVEQLFGLKAREKGIGFACTYAPGCPPWLFGDEGKLRQVLVNLLGNALKFTLRGEVSLTAHFDGQRLQVAVRDTGVGISPQDQANLFQPFQQTASGRASRQGTGLGLALSRQLVHLMGGDLAVSSAEGAGSTFSFSLPFQVADEGVVGAKVPLGVVTRLAPGQPDWLILVADDIPESRAVLVRFLEAWGFRVVEAAHGGEAVERWQAHRPDLTFMDMRMPVLNGREATQRIKALSEGQALVVAQSASAFEEELDTFLQAGCDRSLRKPLRIPEVVQVLEELLGAVFQREEAPPPAPPPSQAPLRMSRKDQADIQQAVLQGDLDQVHALARRLQDSDPVLSAHLEQLAAAFDMGALEALGGAEDG
jgi:signal transduction histidine kinase/CheY-like chemotaxis protein